MEKQFLTLRQFIFTAVLFVFGSSVIMGVNTEAGNNGWFALLVACVMVFPIVLIYARLVKLHPEKNIFEILIIVFGKWAGRIVVVIMMFYCLHLSALVLRNFSEFIKVAVLPETPEIVVMIVTLLPVAYIVCSGMKTLGKWSSVSAAVISFVLLVTVLISINIYKLNYILPVLDIEPPALLLTSVKIASFPLGEIVVFLAVADSVRVKTSSYKCFIWGVYASAVLLMLVILRNTLTLGTMIEKMYFPSFIQAKIIKLSPSIERIEGLISFNFLLAGITKISVCVIAVAKGFSALFVTNDYKIFAMPSSILSLALALVLYKNVIQMFQFVQVYHYYASVFQVFIPVVLWVVSEIRNKVIKKSGKVVTQKKIANSTE